MASLSVVNRKSLQPSAIIMPNDCNIIFFKMLLLAIEKKEKIVPLLMYDKLSFLKLSNPNIQKSVHKWTGTNLLLLSKVNP